MAALVLFRTFGAVETTSNVALTIGQQSITKAQLAMRQRQVAVYYPGQGTEVVAVSQLVRGLLAAEVLASEGTPLTTLDLRAEQQRIEGATKDRPRWEQIKAIYGTNESDLLVVGILPDFAQSRLAQFFSRSSKFTKHEHEWAMSFIRKASVAPNQFGAIAREMGAAVETWEVDAAAGIRHCAGPNGECPGTGDEGASAPVPPERAEFARSVLGDLSPLALGAVLASPVDSEGAFSCLQLLSRQDSRAIVAAAVFRKSDFGDWFTSTAVSVPVRIADDETRAALLREVSWAGRLSLARQ